MEALVRDRIPNRTSDSEEFSASTVRNCPSHAMTGAWAGVCSGGSTTGAGGGAGVAGSAEGGFAADGDAFLAGGGWVDCPATDMPWMNKLDPRTKRSAADLGWKVPRRQLSHFPNPERRTSATPLTPLAAKKRAITERTTRSPEPRWEASLAWSLHHD